MITLKFIIFDTELDFSDPHIYMLLILIIEIPI